MKWYKMKTHMKTHSENVHALCLHKSIEKGFLLFPKFLLNLLLI